MVARPTLKLALDPSPRRSIGDRSLAWRTYRHLSCRTPRPCQPSGCCGFSKVVIDSTLVPEVSPATHESRSMPTPTILLTGATGFIGGATLAHLLESRPECRVLLLARDRGSQSAADRVRSSLARFVGLEQAAARLRSCEVISADLANPSSLGISQLDEATHVIHLASEKKLAAKRLDDVTHVLHLASNTNLRSVRGVRHTNVLGALMLAHRMRRAPKLQRFLYVGTAYICGENSERLVREDMYPRLRARHFTEYTASKAECEMLLESTAPELPLVVARPSVVVGHTRLGCVPSASIFWFYRTCDLLRRLTCPLDSRDDAVPVDWVAAALVFLLFKPALRHRRYHVSAGEGSSVTWEEIAAVFARCYGERPENPYSVVDIPTILGERERIHALCGPGDVDHILTALPIFYRFMEINAEIFDNTRLLDEGMLPPPELTSYLHLCASQPSNRSVYDQMLDDV
jgi:nucleoside-diphosphate-sugar epimerase